MNDITVLIVFLFIVFIRFANFVRILLVLFAFLYFFIIIMASRLQSLSHRLNLDSLYPFYK